MSLLIVDSFVTLVVECDECRKVTSHIYSHESVGEAQLEFERNDECPHCKALQEETVNVEANQDS